MGYDVGGHTKVLEFQGNDQGKLWHVGSFPEVIPIIETPSNAAPPQFMAELRAVLKAAGLYPDADLRGYSICGPIVGNRCLRLINRGVFQPFSVEGEAVLNDGMAATIASLMAGVARGHEGAVALFTLGTGIGFGALHWDPRGRRVLNDGEIHFSIRDSNRHCNCRRTGCFEAAANESALRQYAIQEGMVPDDIGEDLGRRFEQYLQTQQPPEAYRKLLRALETWQGFLAQGIANVFVLLNMGGTDLQPQPLFVMAGGLGALVDPAKLKVDVLDQFEGDPPVGENFQIYREAEIGNRAGCIGAATMALANHLGRDVTEITFLDSPPAK